MTSAILIPLGAEEVPEVEYHDAATKSDALDKQIADEPVDANYHKAQTKTDALEKKSAEDAVDASYDDAATKSDALAKKDGATANIIVTAQSAGSYDTFLTAVEAAGLTDYLSDDDTEVTVFLPDDEAFAALPEGTLVSLLKPENKEKLVSVLKYHIVPGTVMAADVKSSEVETLNGDTFTVVKSDDGTVMINDANVVIKDMEATNGVIHTIDKVIIPES